MILLVFLIEGNNNALFSILIFIKPNKYSENEANFLTPTDNLSHILK